MIDMKELRTQYSGSFLLEYIEKCKSGEIVIGKELMLMLDILLGHFSNPVNIDGTFYEVSFDTSESDTRIKFIEKECKHYEAPFAGKPFLLTLRQRAYIEALYSFKIFDDELKRKARLYQESLLLIARKCGKTPLISAICLAEWFCGELGTKVLCSSNDYEQAGLMFDAINSMREESPALNNVTRKNVKGIFFGNPKSRKKKGKFSYQNKGNIRKISAKTGAKEGKNIKVGAVDEVHELKNNTSTMPIIQALSTQDEPLYFEMTTEGFTEDGYLDDRLRDARQALKGELERPRWLIWLHTQDNESEIWQDEKSWLKSNPDLGVIKKWSFLRKMLGEAKTSSSTRAFVLAKDFNIKQNAAVSWLQESEIINTAAFDIREFIGAWYIGGCDFAETTDLCAVKLLLMKPGEKMVYFYSHYWIPESKLVNAPDDVDYKQWQRDGYLTIVEGNSVDTSAVANWQYELLKEYNLKPFKVGYDNRFAKDYINRFHAIFDPDNDDKMLINVPQDAKCLSNPMRRLEADLKDKLVNYNNCYGDFWCFRNTGVKADNLERIMPCKQERTKRIDGTAAALCCYAVFEWHKSEFLSLVNN